MAVTTAAIFLGASRFDRNQSFSNDAFRRSKADFDDYLRRDSPVGLGLRSAVCCDLFDSPLDPGGQLRRVGQFVDQIKAEFPHTIRNLIVYYVGHGYFGGGGREYYLALASMDSDVPDSTGLRLANLGDVLKSRSRSFRAFYILDCCFAGEALRALQSSADAVAELAANTLRVDGRRIASEAPRRGSA